MTNLTASDLNQIKGLIHYLNNGFRNDAGVTPDLHADVELFNSDGEMIGRVTYVGTDGVYELVI